MSALNHILQSKTVGKVNIHSSVSFVFFFCGAEYDLLLIDLRKSYLSIMSFS